ncbi:unnamed protein product [Lampetra fluviatilis]
MVIGAGLSSSPGTGDGWRHVAEQIDSLCAVLLNLVMLVAPSAVPVVTSRAPSGGSRKVPSGKRRPPLRPREGCPPLRPRGKMTPSWAGPRVRRGSPPFWRRHVERGRGRLGPTEEEALEILPTLLDDISLAVFHSIPAEKKATMREAFAEMAKVYEPPSDTHRKFLQRQQGADESPIAYRGALVALAMAAYPDAEPDMLDPLILGKMLELSKELSIPLPSPFGMGAVTGRPHSGRRGDRRPGGRCGPLGSEEEDRGTFRCFVGAAPGRRWGRPASRHGVLSVWPAGPFRMGLSESSPPSASSRIPTSAVATVFVL